MEAAEGGETNKSAGVETGDLMERIRGVGNNYCRAINATTKRH